MQARHASLCTGNVLASTVSVGFLPLAAQTWLYIMPISVFSMEYNIETLSVQLKKGGQLVTGQSAKRLANLCNMDVITTAQFLFTIHSH